MGQDAKNLVHELTNHLQVVLGHIEMCNFEGCRMAIKDCLRTLRRLRAAVNVLADRRAA